MEFKNFPVLCHKTFHLSSFLKKPRGTAVWTRLCPYSSSVQSLNCTLLSSVYYKKLDTELLIWRHSDLFPVATRGTATKNPLSTIHPYYKQSSNEQMKCTRWCNDRYDLFCTHLLFYFILTLIKFNLQQHPLIRKVIVLVSSVLLCYASLFFKNYFYLPLRHPTNQSVQLVSFTTKATKQMVTNMIPLEHRLSIGADIVSSEGNRSAVGLVRLKSYIGLSQWRRQVHSECTQEPTGSPHHRT